MLLLLPYIGGLAIRYAVCNFRSHLPTYLFEFLIGPYDTFDITIDCIKRRGLLMKYSSHSCPNKYETWYNYVIYSLEGSHVPKSVAPLHNIIVQLLTCFVLGRLDKKESSIIFSKASLIYWLNPVTIAATAASPSSSLLYLAITCALYSTHFSVAISCLCCLILLLYDGVFITMIPFVLALLGCIRPGKYLLIEIRPRNALMVWSLSLLLCLSCFCFLLPGLGFMNNIGHTISQTLTFLHIKSEYHPSAGIFWYLRAQVFSQYYDYFQLLVLAQPFICCIPLLVRLSDTNELMEAAYVSVALVFLFRMDQSFSDFVYVTSLFLTSDAVTLSQVRAVPGIAIGTLVPMCLSPIMFHLWVDVGTGNANYLFFQGLCYWMFSAVGIIEYTRAVMLSSSRIKISRYHSNKKEGA